MSNQITHQIGVNGFFWASNIKLMARKPSTAKLKAAQYFPNECNGFNSYHLKLFIYVS